MTEGSSAADEKQPPPDLRRPDRRMSLFMGGVNAQGEMVPLTAEHLLQRAREWPTTEETPESVAGLLRTSRELFVQSYWVYEFATVAVAWSLLAVERAVRTLVGAGHGMSFKRIVSKAAADGVITARQADVLDTGRELRNRFAHPEQQSVFSYGMAVPALKTSHSVIAEMFTSPA